MNLEYALRVEDIPAKRALNDFDERFRESLEELVAEQEAMGRA